MATPAAKRKRKTTASANEAPASGGPPEGDSEPVLQDSPIATGPKRGGKPTRGGRGGRGGGRGGTKAGAAKKKGDQPDDDQDLLPATIPATPEPPSVIPVETPSVEASPAGQPIKKKPNLSLAAPKQLFRPPPDLLAAFPPQESLSKASGQTNTTASALGPVQPSGPNGPRLVAQSSHQRTPPSPGPAPLPTPPQSASRSLGPAVAGFPARNSPHPTPTTTPASTQQYRPPPPSYHQGQATRPIAGPGKGPSGQPLVQQGLLRPSALPLTRIPISQPAGAPPGPSRSRPQGQMLPPAPPPFAGSPSPGLPPSKPGLPYAMYPGGPPLPSRLGPPTPRGAIRTTAPPAAASVPSHGRTSSSPKFPLRAVPSSPTPASTSSKPPPMLRIEPKPATVPHSSRRATVDAAFDLDDRMKDFERRLGELVSMTVMEKLLSRVRVLEETVAEKTEAVQNLQGEVSMLKTQLERVDRDDGGADGDDEDTGVEVKKKSKGGKSPLVTKWSHVLIKHAKTVTARMMGVINHMQPPDRLPNDANGDPVFWTLSEDGKPDLLRPRFDLTFVPNEPWAQRWHEKFLNDLKDLSETTITKNVASSLTSGDLEWLRANAFNSIRNALGRSGKGATEVVKQEEGVIEDGSMAVVTDVRKVPKTTQKARVGSRRTTSSREFVIVLDQAAATIPALGLPICKKLVVSGAQSDEYTAVESDAERYKLAHLRPKPSKPPTAYIRMRHAWTSTKARFVKDSFLEPRHAKLVKDKSLTSNNRGTGRTTRVRSAFENSHSQPPKDTPAWQISRGYRERHRDTYNNRVAPPSATYDEELSALNTRLAEAGYESVDSDASIAVYEERVELSVAEKERRDTKRADEAGTSRMVSETAPSDVESHQALADSSVEQSWPERPYPPGLFDYAGPEGPSQYHDYYEQGAHHGNPTEEANGMVGDYDDVARQLDAVNHGIRWKAAVGEEGYPGYQDADEYDPMRSEQARYDDDEEGYGYGYE